MDRRRDSEFKNKLPFIWILIMEKADDLIEFIFALK